MNASPGSIYGFSVRQMPIGGAIRRSVLIQKAQEFLD
jgi:hypothetical protein